MIFKRVKGVQRTFGTYSTLNKAITVRDYLIYKKWDLQYLPKRVCNSGKVPRDEYYFHMLPYITCDKEYEKWQKNKIE